MFFDDVEGLIASRTDARAEIKTFLLGIFSEMTRTGAKVMTVATTNRSQAMDSAFLRLFEQYIYVILPDAAAVFSIIQILLKGCDHEPFLDTRRGKRDSGIQRIEQIRLCGYVHQFRTRY